MYETEVWLANIDGDGAGDEEFAEFFVRFYKIWKTNNKYIELTKEDMLNFNVLEFSKWISNCLNEIIFSDEIDSHCWWKKGD